MASVGLMRGLIGESPILHLEGSTSLRRSAADLITSEELMEVPHSTVYEAVRALRPRWLQARSGATLRSRQPQTAMVYIDDPRAAAAAPHVLNRTTNLPGATVAFLIGLMLLTGPVERLSAQQGQGVNGDRVSVFLDCASRFCNLTYFRTELFWVNWVRIPQSSDGVGLLHSNSAFPSSSARPTTMSSTTASAVAGAGSSSVERGRVTGCCGRLG